MSHRYVLRIQEIVRRSVFVLMSSVVALTGLVATPVSAQTVQVADWRQTIPGGVGVALDRAPNGDYAVVGIESLSSLNPTYGITLTLQRYRSTGQPVWSQPVRTTSTVAGFKPTSVRIDADGNIVVLANEADFNSSICVPPGSICPPSTEPLFNAWWLVQKYSPAGALLWQRRQLQVGLVPVLGTFDATGDPYIVLDPNSPARTAVIQKLSGATGATLWTALTPDGAKPGALALSSSGTVLLAGASSLGLSINEYEYASDTGVVRLTRTLYAAAAGYYAPGMALGPQGEIAFTGKSAEGLFLGLENATRQPLFTLSTTPGAQGRQVTVDALGRLVVAGMVPGSSGTNWLLLRYDASGAPLHAPVVIDRHASATEEPLDLILGGEGAAYITGAAGPGTTVDPNGTQAVTVRLALNGNIDWVASESAGVRGVGAALALDGSVAVLTAGDMSLIHYPVVGAAIPTALKLSATSVRGGNRIKGKVTLSTNTGGVVKLTSSNPAVVSVPSTVTVPSGVNSASFDIKTSEVKTDTAVTITATANGMSTSAILLVRR